MTQSVAIQTAEMPTSAELLKSSFSSFHSEAAIWKKLAEELVVNYESQTAEMAQAREGRLALKKLRTSADLMRKDLKAEALSYGNAVQAAYNEVEATIKPIEKILELKEKFAEIKAAERFEALKAERDAEIAPYIQFVPSFANVALLSDNDYALVVSSAMMQSEAEKKRIADDYERFTQQLAEQAEEEKRQAAEREVLRLEMQKMREEQAEKDRLTAEHNARIEAEYRAAQVKAAAEAKAAADKATAEQKAVQAQLDAERAERQRIEKEAAKKAEAERKAVELEAKEKAEAERKAANAPEKSKLIALAIEIDNIYIPKLDTAEALQIGLDVQTLLRKVSAFIREKSAKL